jgi:outer membrane immunogenic protein
MTIHTNFLIAGIALAAMVAGSASSASANGFRVELHGGWDRTVSEGTRDNGVLYGLGVGYDFGIGKGVFAGVEANADFSSTRECADGVLVTGDRLCVKAGRDLSLIARAGVEVAPGSKLYALAGWTNARFRADYTLPSGTSTSEGQNLDGWRIGAGFQQNLGKGLHAKLEYRYSNYRQDRDRHQIVAGFGISF